MASEVSPGTNQQGSEEETRMEGAPTGVPLPPHRRGGGTVSHSHCLQGRGSRPQLPTSTRSMEPWDLPSLSQLYLLAQLLYVSSSRSKQALNLVSFLFHLMGSQSGGVDDDDASLSSLNRTTMLGLSARAYAEVVLNNLLLRLCNYGCGSTAGPARLLSFLHPRTPGLMDDR